MHEDKKLMTVRDDKDREKMGRENLGKFFYDLAKTTFAVMVLGSFMALLGLKEVDINVFASFLTGTVLTTIFAILGNRILKRK